MLAIILTTYFIQKGSFLLGVKATNAEYVKELNRRKIVNMIRSNPISRTELARKTGLTRAAITFIINDLIEEGLVYNREVQKSSIGRHPILLDISPSYGYIAGVLIERDSCYVCITDFTCKLLDSQCIDVSNVTSATTAIDLIVSAIEKMLKKLNISREKFLGVGISSPGPLDYKTGIILAPTNLDMWHKVPVVSMLSNLLDVPAYLENISIALGVAEYRYGSSSAYKSSLFLESTTGIGSSVIINGKVFRGSAGFGVELGHSSLDIDGPLCTCGNKGCFEMYSSFKSLSKQFGDRWPGSWKNVMIGLKENDKNCKEIFDYQIKHLSAALANAINTYDLDCIILAHDFNYDSDFLIERLHEAIKKRSIISRIHPVEIKIAQFGDQPSLRSSAATAIEHCF